MESGDAKMSEKPVRLIVKKASQGDLDAVWRIIKLASHWLSGKNLNHWSKYYSRELVSKMIDKKTVLVGLENGRPVATVTFGNKAPWYYVEPGYGEKFSSPEESAIYLTALAVLPDEHKQGFASKLVDVVEEEAKRGGASWLRLDCRAEVPGLVNFYERRGFVKLGSKPVDEGEDGTYWLMEKKL